MRPAHFAASLALLAATVIAHPQDPKPDPGANPVNADAPFVPDIPEKAPAHDGMDLKTPVEKFNYWKKRFGELKPEKIELEQIRAQRIMTCWSQNTELGEKFTYESVGVAHWHTVAKGNDPFGRIEKLGLALDSGYPSSREHKKINGYPPQIDDQNNEYYAGLTKDTRPGGALKNENFSVSIKIRKTPRGDLIYEFKETASVNTTIYCVGRWYEAEEIRNTRAWREGVTSRLPGITPAEKLRLQRDVFPLLRQLGSPDAKVREHAGEKLQEQLKGPDAKLTYQALHHYGLDPTGKNPAHGRHWETTRDGIMDVLEAAEPPWKDVLSKIRKRIEESPELKRRSEFLVALSRELRKDTEEFRKISGSFADDSFEQMRALAKKRLVQAGYTVDGWDKKRNTAVISKGDQKYTVKTVSEGLSIVQGESAPPITVEVHDLLSDLQKSRFPDGAPALKISVDYSEVATFTGPYSTAKNELSEFGVYGDIREYLWKHFNREMGEAEAIIAKIRKSPGTIKVAEMPLAEKEP